MRILMLTNIYKPHVGGVAHSVEAFAQAYRARGHEVLIVTPEAEGAVDEPGVVRVPALRNFNGSDWSLPVPIPGYLASTLAGFRPEVVHAHHPFLLGATALRIAASWDVPCVFTHHTQYERYTHYWPGDSAAFKRFVADLASGFCDLTDAVVAPSTDIRDRLRAAGVTRPIEVIPTGVDLARFAGGDGAAFRARTGIPADAFVVGHVGRLAPEKNLEFLAEGVIAYLRRNARAHALIVGAGSAEAALDEAFGAAGLADRLHRPGTLTGAVLADAYRAMDAFAFASTSETQGLVLAEAAAAGVPLVALGAPGVCDVVRDRRNGRLIATADAEAFADGLAWVAERPANLRVLLSGALAATAREFSLERSAARMVALYERVRAAGRTGVATAFSLKALWRRAGEELRLISNLMDALLAATLPGEEA